MVKTHWLVPGLAAFTTAALVGCGGSESPNDVALVIPNADPKAAVATPAPATNAAPAAAAPAPAPTAPAEAAAPAATPAAAPAAAAEGYGTIKGKIVWTGGEVPAPEVLVKQGDTTVKDAEVCAKTTLVKRDLIVDAGSKGISNCFAYLVNPKGKNDALLAELKAKDPEVEIDQKNCEYVPFSTGMLKDQALLLKSSDPVNHNVRYQPLNNTPGNYALPGNGSTKVTFKAGERAPTELKCDIHPWMSGWFFIFDHPFFSVSHPDGTFEIKGVPAGKQNLVIRLANGQFINAERAKGKEIDVKANETVEVTFEYKK